MDSGVDYTHKDLSASIVKGFDYVNDDSDPMDDYGQGTHLAGIIAAKSNNAEGIAGVSTGKVLAVKVLDMYGQGQLFDLIQGIQTCADNASVSILLISWTGPASPDLYSAINDAVINKGKLVVAAAGDYANENPTAYYPAAYQANFPNKVIAVASSGQWNGSYYYYTCQSSTTDYGPWITLVAPGVNIYSTFPWDKPFSLGMPGTVQPRYDYYSGTGEAAAFVAAAAARVWGWQPTQKAAWVTSQLSSSGAALNLTGGCWKTDSVGKLINVASAMGRGAVQFEVEDAQTGLPVPGATVNVYRSLAPSTLVASVKVPTYPAFDPLEGRTYPFPDYAEAINLPASTGPDDTYFAKVSATGYTASPQAAFETLAGASTSPDGSFTVSGGQYRYAIFANIPPKSANFSVVSESPNGYGVAPALAVWLPDPTPHFIASQILSSKNSVTDWGSVLPYGSLTGAPYACWMAGSSVFQSVTLVNSKTNSASPWYTGDYKVGVTDGFTSGANYLDNAWVTLLVWKDGVIKQRVNKPTTVTCGSKHWWFPLTIHSPASGAPTYTTNLTSTACGSSTNYPY